MQRFTERTEIRFGEGTLADFANELSMIMKNPVIVTDPGIKNSGLSTKIIDLFFKARSSQIPVYDAVLSNPTVENVDAATRLASEHGCDGVIAIGGGSSIDVAKMVALLIQNGGTTRQYVNITTFPNNPLPLVAIPTSVGTGSEVTCGAVISDPKSKEKLIVEGLQMYPTIALLDPLVVETLPSFIVAATGMDALTHAIEGYTNLNASPFTDALNLAAIERWARNFVLAVDGNNQSRYELLLASCVAGVGFHNSGVGLVHAMANTLGGVVSIHHGLANSILLPHVMRFNCEATVERYAQISRILLASRKLGNQSSIDLAEEGIAHIQALQKSVSLPCSFTESKILPFEVEELAKIALDNPDGIGNPRSYSFENIVKLYRAAM